MDESYFLIPHQWIDFSAFMGAIFLAVFIFIWYKLYLRNKEKKERDNKITEYNKIIQERDINIRNYQHLTEMSDTTGDAMKYKCWQYNPI